MPVKPQFSWEQTPEDVIVDIIVKGFKKEAVDVFISSVFVKVNAPPTYLLALDLLHEVTVGRSNHVFLSAEEAADGNESEGLRVRLRLHKAEPGLVWEALTLSAAAAGGKKALLERREQARLQAEERYNAQLQGRRAQREAEGRRMNEEQWEVERQERRTVEGRAQAEKGEAEAELQEWEQQQQQQQRPAPSSPGDIAAAAAATSAASVGVEPPVRQTETAVVTVNFTPKVYGMPTRARGDDEYYRQSRYKPVSVEDSPMFWKERADAHYRGHQWREAAEAYSESIKRDGVFLTCVMNRAACFLRLAEWRRAVEDCTLALTMLANTPASEITQERYRSVMTKLHARRAAAHCWGGDLVSGLSDLRMAAAYRDPDSDADVQADLETVERLAAERGLGTAEESGGEARAMQAAAAHYYRGAYEDAVEAYSAIIAGNSFHMHARSNLTACLLHLGRADEALEQCSSIVDFCSEVAAALAQPGGLATGTDDSDDDDELNADDEEGEAEAGGEEESNRDELTRQRRLAAKKVSESSGHVYLLLKAYVRGAAALCAKGQYHKAHGFLEQALRITPFDNDLREDCNRIAEKVRMQTLVSASTGGGIPA